MRIGIDARLVYYSRAGIGQYILRLAEALAGLDAHQDQFILLQSRKDGTQMVNLSLEEAKALEPFDGSNFAPGGMSA